MIYNLAKYIDDNTTIDLITNGYNPATEGDGVNIILSGGSDDSRGLKIDDNVQFLSRSTDQVTAYELIREVFDLLKNRFKILLPEVTVKNKVYPAVEVSQMLPRQTPGYIGTNNNGLHQWSVNFQITTEE